MLNLGAIKKHPLLISILLLYILGLLLRLLPLWIDPDTSFYKWKGEHIPVTKDAFFWGAITQKVAYGMHGDNAMIPGVERGALPAIALVLTRLGIPLESVMFYLPLFLAPLLAIPLLLIAYLFKERNPWVVASGVLFACTTNIIYARTAAGYFDTDLFSLTIPLFIVFFLMKHLRSRTPGSMLGAALTANFFPYFYRPGITVLYSLIFIYVLYSLIARVKEKENWKGYILLLLSLIEIPVLSDKLIFPLYLLLRGLLIVGAFFLLRKREVPFPVLILLTLLLFAGFLVTAAPLRPIVNRLNFYAVDHESIGIGGYHFFPVASTIAEAGESGLTVLAARTAGSVPVLICGLLGYIVLAIRRREFILLLPFPLLGLFAFWGGIRFGFYLPVVSAFSLGYLAVTLVSGVTMYIKALPEKASRIIPPAAGVLFLVIFTLPNLFFILKDKRLPSTRDYLIEPLAKLKEDYPQGGYVLSNWGAGGIIWFYSGMKTIHAPSSINDNLYLTSRILRSSSPFFTANLARLSVAAQEAGREDGAIAINYILNKYVEKPEEYEAFFASLDAPEYKWLENEEDVFFYFYYDLLKILPTNLKYSSIDLATGAKSPLPLFFLFTQYTDSPDFILFPEGPKVEKQSGIFISGERKFYLNTFVTVNYNTNKELQVDRKVLRPDAPYYLIFNKSFKSFIILDKEMYDSSFVQMFLLENYDKELFEAVYLDPRVKVFRLR